MATCRHKHLELRDDGLYRCIVCSRPFVAEPAEVAAEPVEAPPKPIKAAPKPVQSAPRPVKAARKSADVVELAVPQNDVAPDVEPEPEVDVASQLRIYLAGKPREVPASARRRKAKRR
jgi:hypothetical protein